MSTLEGWPDYMQQALDASIDGPKIDNNQFVIALFVVYILIGSIFCVNLFIAIVGMNYNSA